MSDKYNFLLTGEVALIALYPLVEAIDTKFPLMHLIFLGVVIPGLFVVIPFRAFLYVTSLAMISFGFHILSSLGFFYGPIEKHFEVLRLILNITFCSVIIVCLIRSMSLRQTITHDIVKGGISAYFLMAVLWALIYQLLLTVSPNAFANVESKSTDCIYYSFATITTLGPGDVTPISTWAKFLAVLETFLGQIYLATFVARLVAFSIMKKQEMKNENYTNSEAC